MKIIGKSNGPLGTQYEFDDGATLVVNEQGRVPITMSLKKPLAEYKAVIMEGEV